MSFDARSVFHGAKRSQKAVTPRAEGQENTGQGALLAGARVGLFTEHPRLGAAWA